MQRVFLQFMTQAMYSTTCPMITTSQFTQKAWPILPLYPTIPMLPTCWCQAPMSPLPPITCPMCLMVLLPPALSLLAPTLHFWECPLPLCPTMLPSWE